MRNALNPVHVVWFKRDLRIADHAPLALAASKGPVLPLYVIEPELWLQADSDARHWRFIRASLLALRERLGSLGQALVVREGQVEVILDKLHRSCGIAGLLSHEETGNAWTFERDKRVSAYLREQGIPWHQIPQFGVTRGLRDRNRWSDLWEQHMRQALAPQTLHLKPLSGIDHGEIPEWPSTLTSDLSAKIQEGGEYQAREIMDDFLSARAIQYSGGISSPLKARTACSRLSPHLAYGTLSMRELVHNTRARRAQVRELPPGYERQRWSRSLKGFEERLHWHCHFIQKLESQPDLEFCNMHRACDGLRESEFNEAFFSAWASGQTGMPLVDASMRSLLSTGWLNFRMRAMLVSFASYHLWLHWRRPAQHLARLFTDYEPGIHYCQMQMQSGTTGINALRIYNPVKQSQDQDPQGGFIRRWVPELAHFPETWIHHPWAAPMSVQQKAGCILDRDYPLPIVDHEHGARQARQRMIALRRTREAHSEAKLIHDRHGSRRRQKEGGRAKPAPSKRQLDLFS